MKPTWIVFANTTLAHIYSMNSPSINLVHSFSHELSRAKDTELGEDRPGHYQKGAAGRGAYEPQHTLKENEQEKFAKEITDYLEKNRTTQQFEHLIIICAPRFRGLLSKHFHEPLKKLITKTIEKDIVELSEHELTNYIKELKIH